MSDLAWLSLGEAAARIRNRSLSPVEYVGALIARIERYDPALNAFLQFRPEPALEAARRAEAAVMEGQPLGPLHGVPFALKDIIDAADWNTTCHSKLLADNAVSADAEVTRRLRAAGGILLGKLSTHEFAFGGPSFDLPWPPARNPWNRRMAPGGSSSGSGAAVAAGFVPLALGSDTGGSVRNPASMCGIVGMKASYGRVSRRGVFPLSYSLDHVGPLTRTVAENALALSAIAGHDPADPGSAEMPVPDFAASLDGTEDAPLRGLRVGLVRHFHNRDMIADAEMAASIERGAAVLGELGAEVRDVAMAPLAAYRDCNRTILLSEACAIHAKWVRERPQDYGALARERLAPGLFLRAVDYVQAMRARAKLTADYLALMREVDVLVCASAMEPPYDLDDDAARDAHYPRQARTPFNVVGAPAIAVPTGFTETGLPLSMQIAGRPWEEALIYRVASAHERATGWTGRHPDLDVTAAM